MEPLHEAHQGISACSERFSLQWLWCACSALNIGASMDYHKLLTHYILRATSGSAVVAKLPGQLPQCTTRPPEPVYCLTAFRKCLEQLGACYQFKSFALHSI